MPEAYLLPLENRLPLLLERCQRLQPILAVKQTLVACALEVKT